MKKNFSNNISKNRIVILSIVSIILVFSLLLGSTYSLFVTGNVDEEANIYQTGVLDITYTLSDDNVSFASKTPISEEEADSLKPYRITIINNGNVGYKFDLILVDTTASDVINYDYITTKVGKLESKILSDCENNIIKSDIIVPAGESVDVDVKFWLNENTTNTEIGKSFYGKLKVDGFAIYNENEDIDNSVLIANYSMLSSMEVGSYVAYTGSNGCEGEACNGLDVSSASTYNLRSVDTFSKNGWRIAYKEGNNIYLTTAGSPEYLCTNSDGTTSNSECSSYLDSASIDTHITNLNNVALKYCNPTYVAGGVCDNRTTWNMGNSDYKKITGNEIDKCFLIEGNATCGYNNNLIDNGNNYWFSNMNSTTNQIFIWGGVDRRISNNTTDNAFGIRPIVKLDASIYITEGKGSGDNPYVIEIPPIEKRTYKVSFDVNGGEGSYRDINVVYNSFYGELPTPVRSGYAFEGWYTDSDLTNKVTIMNEVSIERDHTLYARWVVNTYTVTFNPNEGSVSTTSKSVTYDDVYGDLPIPTREGYNFLGWYTEVDGGIKITNTSPVVITKDTSLYAHWELGIINITFDPNGGSVDTTTMDVIFGSTYGTLPTPTRTGYTFNGWYTSSSGGSKIESTTTVTTKTAQTLYAQWSINTYTVSYYNGATLINTSSHTYGTAKNLTTWSNLGASVTNSSVGWSFSGWSTANNNTTRNYTDGASVNNLTESAGGNVNLYAVYTRTITFKHGASAASSSTATQYWNPAGTTNGTHVGSVTSPTLTAITNWTASGFRNDTTASSKEYDANASIYPVPGESATLYGAYTRSVTFYSGASKATSHGSKIQYLNSNSNTVSAITSYTPTAITNWSALGFRADTTASSQSYGSNTSISPAYTTGNSMYAVYSRTLTISYNGNSNTGGSTSNTTKTVYLNSNSTTTSSQAVTLAANGFSRTGHTFSKWAAGSASGTQYAASGSYTASVAYNASTFGVTMFAVWTANTYTVSFNANGGTTGTSSKTVTYGSTYGSLPTPTRTNYSFNGWYTAASGGTKVTSSSTVTITAAQTLYAQWTMTDLVLYDNGSNPGNLIAYTSYASSIVFDTNKIYRSTRGGFRIGSKIKVDLSKYKKLYVTAKVTQGYSGSSSKNYKYFHTSLKAGDGAGGISSTETFSMSTTTDISVGTTQTVEVDISGKNDNIYLTFEFRCAAPHSATSSALTLSIIAGEIYKIWLTP